MSAAKEWRRGYVRWPTNILVPLAKEAARILYDYSKDLGSLHPSLGLTISVRAFVLTNDGNEEPVEEIALLVNEDVVRTEEKNPTEFALLVRRVEQEFGVKLMREENGDANDYDLVGHNITREDELRILVRKVTNNLVWWMCKEDL